MLISTLAGLLPFLASAQAYFVLSQPILMTTRLDPIVNPGGVGTHVHSIAGGSNFDKSMDYASSRASKCTTAPVSVDLSNYWIPQMYYYNPTDETYQAIPVANMNAYYLPRAGADGIVKAFPDGLRMLSGTPNRRDFDASDPYDVAISYVCLDYSGTHANDPAYAQRNSFFSHNCAQGMRAQVNFPPCWDGKNLDSEDHQSHMAWPSGGVDGGECPSSHPEHLVSLFYEFIYEVQNFPFNNGSQPTWVFANGDTTGYGLHADFINGWPALVNGTNILQQAIDGCNANNGVGGDLQNCPPFVPYLQLGGSCSPENPYVDEDVGFGHPISSLPGNNPLWMGNGTKPIDPDYSDNVTYTTFASVIPAGYNDVGCIAEGPNGRALTGAHYSNSNVTRGACVSFCQSFGYPLAGVEYGQECYCGVQMSNGASNTTLLPSSQCGKPCANNSYENCGGSSTLELFNNPSLYPSSTVPSGWSALGCVQEATNARALPAASLTSNSMTVATCLNFCGSKGYQYGGIEYSSQCFCDNALKNGITVNSTSTACNMACAGDGLSICGGPSALSLFVNPAFAPASSSKSVSSSPVANATSTVKTTTTGTMVNATSSTISPAAKSSSTIPPAAAAMNATTTASPTNSTSSTVPITKSTTTAVVGTPMVVSNSSSSTTAVASTNSTTISKTPTSTSVLAPSSLTLNSTSSTLSSTSSPVVKPTTTITPTNSTSSVTKSSTTIVSSTTSAASSSTVTSTTSTKPATISSTSTTPTASTTSTSTTSTTLSSTPSAAPAPSLPAGWSPASSPCIAEAASGRALRGASTTSSQMTTAMCLNYCSSQGFQYAGIEYASECYCSGTLSNGATLSKTSTNCNMGCSGAKGEICGGGGALTLYVNPSLAPVIPAKISTYAYQGCIAESSNGRALAAANWNSNSMTIESCVSFCQGKNYTIAGLEYSSQCYCANAYTGGVTASTISDNCYMKCGGNSTEICGGPSALTVYQSS